MPDPTTRRGWLLAAIQSTTGQWTTQRAEHALATSPFSCHRNTARKDLRALCRAGALAPVIAGGRRRYIPTPLPVSAPLRCPECQLLFEDCICGVRP